MQGFSLVYVTIIITVVAAVAAAMVSITSTTQFSQLREHYIMQARYVAMAGLAYLNTVPTNHRSLKDQIFEVHDDQGNLIGQYTFTSVQRLTSLKVQAGILGVAAPGTAREATYYMEGEAQEDSSAIASSVQEDFEDFTVINSDPTKQGTKKVDGKDDISYSSRARRGSASESEYGGSDGKEVTPGEVDGPNAFSVGAGEFNNFGIATFTGSRNFKYNTCVEGECDFKLGMRFFMTVWYEQNDADGLVITLFNGDNNDKYAVGGNSKWGEMIAYAGDSRVYSGSTLTRFVDPGADGIQAPKLGVEIDNYGNEGKRICGYSNNQSKSQYWYRKTEPTGASRYDYGGGSGPGAFDHIAFVGWGLDLPWGCAWYKAESTSAYSASTGGKYSNAAGSSTYDDNQHTRESWMWNPLQYHNPVANRDNEVTMRTSSVRRVAQTFYLEEPLRPAQAHIYLRTPAGTKIGKNLKAYIYATTTSGSGRVPTGGYLAESTANTDTVTDRILPTDGTTSSSTKECIYTDGTAVFVGFNFTGTWSTSKSDLLTPGWYALVLEYGTSNSDSNLRVQVDSTAPTHPGNFATYNGSNWSTDSSRDMIFYVLFDPPNFQRAGKLANNTSRTYESAVFPVITDSANPTSYDNGAEVMGNSTNWKLFKQNLAIRMEVHRGKADFEADVYDPDATVTDGTHGDASNPYHPYRMIVWVRRCDNPSTADKANYCPKYINSYFADTSGDLDTDKNPPALERTFYLSTADHNKFDTFLLGITQATGGATQEANFSNIIMQFRAPKDIPIDERACAECNDFDD
ncbi:hypothetical protein DGI_2668 [Megalodesulfovibrio gigas DSM 1382 = ATCC 19364]|uniref:Uncharacterized protein n=2 Tax=Megalodesulfovibrio gigas TaxID=879 RepID=T2GDZ2_MEGG1|nr:hypothetical protein DGI_2668 [Megalodesulfovibrio gigas DSM 1382 = ATCC 19364]